MINTSEDVYILFVHADAGVRCFVPASDLAEVGTPIIVEGEYAEDELTYAGYSDSLEQAQEWVNE